MNNTRERRFSSRANDSKINAVSNCDQWQTFLPIDSLSTQISERIQSPPIILSAKLLAEHFTRAISNKPRVAERSRERVNGQCKTERSVSQQKIFSLFCWKWKRRGTNDKNDTGKCLRLISIPRCDAAWSFSLVALPANVWIETRERLEPFDDEKTFDDSFNVCHPVGNCER